jgi:hypothetical protein
MLKIQSMILRKLATNENHLKGLIKVLGKVIVNFDKRVKEIIEALMMLRY